jgi:hypothetical protein
MAKQYKHNLLFNFFLKQAFPKLSYINDLKLMTKAEGLAREMEPHQTARPGSQAKNTKAGWKPRSGRGGSAPRSQAVAVLSDLRSQS